MDLNPIDWIKSHVNEQWVVNLIADIKKDVGIVETDIDDAINWLVSNAPSLVSQANLLMQLVGELGVYNPQVTAAIKAVNTATASLNALANAKTAGQSDAQAMVAAYTAMKGAVGATATAAANAVATAPAAAKPAKAA